MTNLLGGLGGLGALGGSVFPHASIPNPGGISDSAVADTKVHLTAALQQAGWPANLVPTAAAVTMAESGADEDVVNPLPCSADGDHAVGAMQVCTINAGVAGFSSDKDTFKKQMQNYANNFKAGYAIYQEQGWGAWATYKSGAFKKHMGQDPLLTTDKNSLTDNNIVNAVSDTVDATASIAKSIAKVIAALFDPSTYFRLGKGVLGGILLILGTAALVFVIADKVSGGKSTKAVTDAAMVAAVA